MSDDARSSEKKGDLAAFMVRSSVRSPLVVELYDLDGFDRAGVIVRSRGFRAGGYGVELGCSKRDRGGFGLGRGWLDRAGVLLSLPTQSVGTMHNVSTHLGEPRGNIKRIFINPKIYFPSGHHMGVLESPSNKYCDESFTSL